tara:strand:+ start:4434 stop:4709 length:276 start_codon:yes stop_codon:yes gene_type:complete
MENVINKFVNLFPHADKVLHFIVGALISLITCLLIQNPGDKSQYGMAFATIFGLGKEYGDHVKKGAGGIDTWLDLFATMLGGAVVAYMFRT